MEVIMIICWRTTSLKKPIYPWEYVSYKILYE
jgi:hypothetical protein